MSSSPSVFTISVNGRWSHAPRLLMRSRSRTLFPAPSCLSVMSGPTGRVGRTWCLAQSSTSWSSFAKRVRRFLSCSHGGESMHNGRPFTPAHCDFVQFQAHLPKDSLVQIEVWAPRSRNGLCNPLPSACWGHGSVQWSRLQAWPLRVLKALGPREWLVGTESPPPEGWLRPCSPSQFSSAAGLCMSSRQDRGLRCPLPHSSLILPLALPPLTLSKSMMRGWITCGRIRAMARPVLIRRPPHLCRSALYLRTPPSPPSSSLRTTACRSWRLLLQVSSKVKRHRPSSPRPIGSRST